MTTAEQSAGEGEEECKEVTENEATPHEILDEFMTAKSSIIRTIMGTSPMRNAEVISIFHRHELEKMEIITNNVMFLTRKETARRGREAGINEKQEMDKKLERTLTIQFERMKEQIDELRKDIVELKNDTEQINYYIKKKF